MCCIVIKSQPNDKGISYVVWFVSLDVCLRKLYVYVCNSSCYLCYNGIKCYKDNVNSVALCGQGCLIATSYYNIWFFYVTWCLLFDSIMLSFFDIFFCVQ